MAGAALTLEHTSGGPWVLATGLALLLALFFFWFGTVIRENQAGVFNLQVDRSFRMGMSWFIFSEVMFFAAFFGALFYARQIALPWLSGEGAKHMTNLLLWKGFEGGWPTNGPAALGPRGDGSFETIPALGVPLVNTAILLSSRRHDHGGAPRAPGRQARPAEGVPRRDLRARLHVRLPAGGRVPPRLHRARA